MKRTWFTLAAGLLLLLTPGCSFTDQPVADLSPSAESSPKPVVPSQEAATPTGTIEPLPVAPGEIWLVNETDLTLLCFDSQTLAQKAAK